MKKSVTLKRSPYESAKIAVKRGSLYSEEELDSLKKLEFEEILKYMEEHGFKEPIDTSYLAYEGFYLIEVVLNKYLSLMYGDVMVSSSSQNREFLESYYLKYQIHNLMALVRCRISNEKDITPYLIGDNRRQEKYVKAFEMPLEDAIVYISKKLKFNETEVLGAYSKGLFDLENYLYAQYYKQIFSFDISYNNSDEHKFRQFIQSYIDILNARAFLKLKVDGIEKISFDDIFVSGGKISRDTFTSFESITNEEVLEKFSELFSMKITSFSTLDRAFNNHKQAGSKMFKQIKFGSPFYVLKFFFELENQITSLRYLLKAKYMKLTDDEIESLMGGNN
ncbi:MAG: V-type ATPase subunit [Nanoarchaeota archaeon]|nr:V-type ATPase subunit [Nanoarchaeota archaeon]